MNTANMIANMLDQLTRDYYPSTYTELTEKKAPIAKVVPTEDGVEIQVRGEIIFEFSSAISDAGFDEQLHMGDPEPEGAIPLRANQYMTLTLHSKKEALKLAAALMGFPLSIFLDNYLSDRRNGPHSFENDPELLAQITSVLITDLRDHAEGLGAGTILEKIEEKVARSLPGKGREDR